MIVGFLALRFLGKTSVLCVIDMSLCALWLWSWFNCFRKNNSRSDSVFNKWQKLLDQENRRNTLICIEISIVPFQYQLSISLWSYLLWEDLVNTRSLCFWHGTMLCIQVHVCEFQHVGMKHYQVLVLVIFGLYVHMQV